MQTGERTLPARGKYVAAALLASAAIACSPLSPAMAADITPAVTVSETTTAGTYDINQQIRVTINWSVPSAAAGDTFTAPLDKALDPDKFVPFNLLSPTGDAVAAVAIKRDALGDPIRDVNGDAILEFTFTDFASTHSNLTGEAWFDIGFDLSVVTFPGTTSQVDTTVYGTPITVTRSTGPVGNEHTKFGNWRNSEAEATALNPDGSLTNPNAGIRWTIQLQGGAGNQVPGWTSVTVTDTPGPGQHFNCTSPTTLSSPPALSFLRWDAASASWVGSNVPQANVTSCQLNSLTVVVTKDTADDNIYRFRVPTWLDTPLLDSYSNSANLSYVAPQSEGFSYAVQGSVARSASGGSGNGIVVLAPGAAKLALNKVSLAKRARAGGTTAWRIAVRNTGTAEARNVRVCDLPLNGQSFSSLRAGYRIGSVRRTVRLRFSNGRACVTIPRLGIGQRALLTVRTQIPATARGRVRNLATASATGISLIRDAASVPVLRPLVPVPLPSPTG